MSSCLKIPYSFFNKLKRGKELINAYPVKFDSSFGPFEIQGPNVIIASQVQKDYCLAMPETDSSSFSIIKILRHIVRHQETGRLTFEETGKMITEVFFLHGHIIHASNGKSTGDDAVYQLLNKKIFKTLWSKNQAPTQNSVSKTDEILLLGALGILTEDAAKQSQKDSAQPPKGKARPFGDNTASSSRFPLSSLSKLPDTSATQAIGVSEPNRNTTSSHLLGDKVLRPPRLRNWKGLPLPFVPAYDLNSLRNFTNMTGLLELLLLEKFSGYISIVVEKRNLEALLILLQGKVIHTRLAEGKYEYVNQVALDRINNIKLPEKGESTFLLYPLDADFVHSYCSLITGEKLLESFSAASLKINKLLNTLENSRHTGIICITNGLETGYIFLNRGGKLGCFYEIEGTLEESTLRVYHILGKSGSIINVITSLPLETILEYSNQPKSALEVKQFMKAVAIEALGKKANRIVNIIAQAKNTPECLKAAAEQTRKETLTFMDKALAERLYQQFINIIQELK